MTEIINKSWNTRPYVIILSIIGVVFTIFYLEIGLTLIAFSGLLTAAEFIRERLKKIGAESWALGSIIVGLGFLFFTIPVIGFAWSFISTSNEIILVVIGVILMIIGYTTEYFDLNVKLLNFIENVKIQYHKLIQKIKAKFLRSVWTISAVFSFTLLILSYFYPVILEPLSGILPNYQASSRLLLISLAVLFLLIEYREFMGFMFVRFGEFLTLLMRGIIRRLVNIKEFFVILFKKGKSLLQSSITFLKDIIVFSFENTFIIGFSSFLIFGILSLLSKDLILSSLSVISLIISLGLILVKYEQAINVRVRTTQQTAYKSAFRIKNLVMRKKFVNCPNCDFEIVKDSINCLNCNESLPKCMICKDLLRKDQEFEECHNCEYHFHKNHIDKWIQILPKCPICKTEWQLT
ncbi:MAG: hypothetical protein GPJ54_20750 [Candidatus Heimdallarchaeota archaeon]|nr:hypothetical protein [Candidatus Heimdallarchaeota archaeon]